MGVAKTDGDRWPVDGLRSGVDSLEPGGRPDTEHSDRTKQ